MVKDDFVHVLNGIGELADMLWECRKDLPGIIATAHQWWGRHRCNLEGQGLATFAQVFDLDFWTDALDRMKTADLGDGRTFWRLTPSDRLEVARLVDRARVALDQIDVRANGTSKDDGNTEDEGGKLPLARAKRATVDDAQRALQQLVGVIGAQGVKDLPNEGAVLAALWDRLGFRCSPKTLRATPMRRSWVKAQKQARETFVGDLRRRLLVVANHDADDYEGEASAG